MIVTRTTTVDDVRDRIKPLLHAHWEEVALDKDVAPLVPAWDVYRKAESRGMLLVVVAEDDEEIVAYSVFFIVDMIHNLPNKLAQNDIIYIDPAYRGLRMWNDLMRTSKQEARKRGATFLSMHVKAGHNFGPLLERANFYIFDTVYRTKL